MDIMIDIETLSTKPNATILNIAAQAFDPFSTTFYEQQFYTRVDTEDQDGRDIDDGTMEWWAKQGADAQEEAFGEDNRMLLKESLEQLTKICWNADRIWANGIAFDMTILEDAYKSFGMPIPWQYYKVCDARTVYKMNPDRERLGNSHHALEDVILQIDLLQRTLAKLGIKSLG